MTASILQRQWVTGTEAAVPVTVPVPKRWRISQVAGKWGAFQSWAGNVYWLRLFDSYDEAAKFVREAVEKASRPH